MLASQNSNFHFVDLYMIIARTLLNLWSWDLDQMNPYIVPELFRGVPRPKTDFQKSRFLQTNDFNKWKTQTSGKKRRLRPIAKAATAHYFEISDHPEKSPFHLLESQTLTISLRNFASPESHFLYHVFLVSLIRCIQRLRHSADPKITWGGYAPPDPP